MESVKAFKRKMLLWASNWSQEDPQQSTEEVSFTPDAMEISFLLQALGFRIRFMDRCLPKEMHPVPEVRADFPACRVILMCPRSGIRMQLDAQTSSCRCPSPENSDLGHTWEVSEPTSEEMMKAVDSLGPRPSTEISRSVSQLIGGLFQVMSLFPDLNHNNIPKTVDSKIFSNAEMQQTAQSATSASRNSPMKTPATGINVVTPNAPCGPKALPNDSKTVVPGRYRSLDTLITCGGFPDDLPEPGPLTPKDDEKSGPEMDMEVDDVLNTTITQGPGSASKKNDEDEENPAAKKISQKKLLRSDTYVSDSVANDIKEEPRMGPPPGRTPSPLTIPAFSHSAILLSKLQEIQVSISDIIFMVAGNEKNLSNIGDVSKASKAVAGALQRITTDNTVRPIRCLSDFGSVPNVGRSSMTVRSIPRPNMKRYTMSIAAPATPTTSRRGGTNAIDRTKKGSTTAFSKSMPSKINRLVPSAGNISQKSCTSPSSTAANTSASKNRNSVSNASPNRRVTNSDKKCANSNIPKPGTIRK